MGPFEMSDLVEDIVVSLAAAAVIAALAAAWSYLLRQTVLTRYQGTPSLKGRWRTVWEIDGEKRDEILDITYQAGSELRGTRQVVRQRVQSYKFRGRVAAWCIVGHFLPVDTRLGSPVSVFFRISDPTCTRLNGSILWPDGESGEILSAGPNEWDREET